MNQHTMIDREVKTVLKKSKNMSISEILRSCNTKILYADLEQETGGFTTSNSRCHTIVINSNYTGILQTFVIFHELGHLRLHNGVSTPFYRTLALGSFVPKIEREANEFALKLLVSTESTNNISDLLNKVGLPQSMKSYL
ncbi:ImmA/IrrE family metallo-endopeptidase [Listeria fleischmannii]|uniref:Domain of uncharacterized function (DUF955) n=1 Tax=Listeria fleischmannii subsp. fleischmannii TaxID=1671902 RepID=A0A2X3J2Q2_9LIST|nr:ImmA/IrrE family metallo-endopeptidase [Listeria fleischmannii]EMG27501.1 hypothetical protein LFLEISCH_10699 [Listeria fleischmannii subsp. fleischmannii LU2006-1]SQC67349.1 Domain of uncharacterised function (DUF955) [Listeria fleischmannii subsp. fleischmannii]